MFVPPGWGSYTTSNHTICWVSVALIWKWLTWYSLGAFAVWHKKLAERGNWTKPLECALMQILKANLSHITSSCRDLELQIEADVINSQNRSSCPDKLCPANGTTLWRITHTHTHTLTHTHVGDIPHTYPILGLCLHSAKFRGKLVERVSHFLLNPLNHFITLSLKSFKSFWIEWGEWFH
jgi:hypothetical protein